MTTLQQQQNEARVEFRKSAGVVYSENSLGPILDKVIARTREQTLQEVEEGIPPPLKEPQHARIMKPDGHLEAKYTWNKHRQAVLAHLRTLREGITGNEKI